MIPFSDNIRSRRFPVVNVSIIVACVVVFLLQVTQQGFTERWIFKPIYLFSVDGWHELGVYTIGATILASMFMHGGLMHIGFNMLFLWVFGDNVEDRMGHLKYLIFYLVCGAVATVAHSLLAGMGDLLSLQPQVEGGPSQLGVGLVGASGAISGVLAAYYRLFKGAYVRTLIFFFFITVVQIPAGAFIIMWFIFQLFYMVISPFGAGGTAYGAHVGGFIAGYLLCQYFCWTPRRRRPDPRVVDIRFLD